MAAGVPNVAACSLVDIGSLRLGNTLIHPSGICVHKDMIVITDPYEWSVLMYRSHDGELLAKSGQLDSPTFSICFINDKEICVTMRNGTIEIMSIGDMGVITRVRQLRINNAFQSCQGIVRLMENVAVCGINGNTIYWCLVSLNDEPIGSIHRISKGRISNLTTKDNIVYIACDNSHDDSTESGVYGYDIHNPDKHTVLYKHGDLNFPKGITVDSAGYLFVCNFIPPCIHHLTDKCELLTIYRERISIRQHLHIFWDNDIIYATYVRGKGHCWENLITRYKPKYSYEQGDHKVSELKDELKQSFIEEAPIEQEIQLQRSRRILYGDDEVVYLKPGDFPSIVKCIEIREPPSVPETETFALTHQEAYTTNRNGVSCSDPKTLCQVLNKATQDASSSRSILERNCLRVGLKFHGETPRNGNCFFEAVSSQLQRLNSSVQKSPEQLRHDVVIFIKTNRILKVSEGTIDLAEYLENETFEHYCIRMDKDGEWADHVVIVGMARMLLSDILIVTTSPSAGPDDNIVWVVGEPNFQGNPILLGHMWEHHYESLESIDNTTPEVEEIYQRNQHSSEDSQAKTKQQIIKDTHTHKSHLGSEDPQSHTEQTVGEDPYTQSVKHLIKDPYTETKQRVQNTDSAEETCLSTSNQTVPEEGRKPVLKRALPPRKKYHAFFSYASPDIQWVKQTVNKLEKDHGFVCCEYDRDNTPGTPLMKFADDSISNAYKTVVVMTREAFKSGFVLLEIQMAMNNGFIEKRNCVVPVLVEDCEIPGYLKVLNYVDARDTNRSNMWWPKLLMELECEGK